MRKLFVMTIAFVLAFTACDGRSGFGDINGGDTTLTIKNESFSDITNVTWQGVSFGLIRAGESVNRNVQANSGYIRFRRTSNPMNARTSDLVVIANEESFEFIFIDDIVIVDTDNADRIGTFRNLQPQTPNYQMGGRGPGGGTIFFAEGGQYKEVTGELGIYSWNDAVTRARNHRGGGFDDWSLPDRGELSLMYNNLHRNGLGGFNNNGWYWSSSQTDSEYYAWAQWFSNEDQQRSLNKSSAFSVRAVRSF